MYKLLKLNRLKKQNKNKSYIFILFTYLALPLMLLVGLCGQVNAHDVHTLLSILLPQLLYHHLQPQQGPGP